MKIDRNSFIFTVGMNVFTISFLNNFSQGYFLLNDIKIIGENYM